MVAFDSNFSIRGILSKRLNLVDFPDMDTCWESQSLGHCWVGINTTRGLTLMNSTCFFGKSRYTWTWAHIGSFS